VSDYFFAKVDMMLNCAEGFSGRDSNPETAMVEVRKSVLGI
jgi:hypothetical protein